MRPIIPNRRSENKSAHTSLNGAAGRAAPHAPPDIGWPNLYSGMLTQTRKKRLAGAGAVQTSFVRKGLPSTV